MTCVISTRGPRTSDDEIAVRRRPERRADAVVPARSDVLVEERGRAPQPPDRPEDDTLEGGDRKHGDRRPERPVVEPGVRRPWGDRPEPVAGIAQCVQERRRVQHPLHPDRVVARRHLGRRGPLPAVVRQDAIVLDGDAVDPMREHSIRPTNVLRDEGLEPPSRVEHVVVRGHHRDAVLRERADVGEVLLVRAEVLARSEFDPACHEATQPSWRLGEQGFVIDPHDQP